MRRRAARVSDVRAALIEQFRDLVDREPRYAYAPSVYWGPTFDALRDGRPVRLLGDTLRWAGAPIALADQWSMFELATDDSITLIGRPGGA